MTIDEIKYVEEAAGMKLFIAQVANYLETGVKPPDYVVSEDPIVSESQERIMEVLNERFGKK